MQALKQINGEIEDFKTRPITIVPGLSFNQYDTIQKIFFYYNSKFTTGDTDDDGDKKYFYNITKNPCKVFSKAVDFDTKNIRLLTTDGGDPLKTWFMERDLKFWMRDKQFGKVLNRIFKELPIFGSVVLKVIEGTPYFVDLRNFYVDQSAECLEDSNFITEIHNYSPTEFRRVAKQMGWDKSKVNECLDEFYKMKGQSHLRVFERYGEMGDAKDDGSVDYTYKRIYIADVGVDKFDPQNQTTIKYPGIILDEQEFDPEKLPYWEFHADRMAGRWLGIGVVETLFEPQIRQNELCNLQSKSSHWLSLHIFQTRDTGFNRNLNGDVRNGETLNVDSEITEVNISDRNLAHFNEENNKWMRNRDELTFSYDVVQGERLPAGTPLGSAQIAVSQTLSYFEQIQENIALDVKEMLYSVIIPQFEKENSVEHTLRLVGQDLDVYIEMVKNDLVMKEIIRQINAGKPLPTNEEKDTISIAIEESIKQGKEKLITIPRNFYKDVKYDVDIDITGESVDTRVRYATKFALLQAMTSDPTMTTDPVKRKFLFSMAEDGGINPNDFFDVDKKELADLMPQMSGRAGGGVSAPAMGAAMGGQTPTTV